MFKILQYFTIISLLSLPIAMQTANDTLENIPLEDVIQILPIAIQVETEKYHSSIKNLRLEGLQITAYAVASILTHKASQNTTNSHVSTTCKNFRNVCVVTSLFSAACGIWHCFTAHTARKNLQQLQEIQEATNTIQETINRFTEEMNSQPETPLRNRLRRSNRRH